MSNVVSLFAEDLRISDQLRELHPLVCESLSADQRIEAIAQAKTLLSQLAIAADGHVVRISEAGNPKVVLAITSMVQLLHGSFPITRFTDRDDAPGVLRFLKRNSDPRDLGSYADFLARHEALHQLLTTLPACPPPGVRMAQTINTLTSLNVLPTRAAVEHVLNQNLSVTKHDLPRMKF